MRIWRWLAAGATVALIVGVLVLASVDHPAVAAPLLLLNVVVVARLFGATPALLAAGVGAAAYSYFFLPPEGFGLESPDDWIAFITFVFTAVIAGELASRAERRAAEAQAGRREIERLYQELQAAFERASEAEAARRNEALKAALLDALTHNLRTPLTAIKAAVTALIRSGLRREPELPIEGRLELLQVINEESDRLDRFVEGLTKLARIDAGDMRLNFEPASVEEIVTTALKLAEPRTRTHRMEVWIDDLPLVTVDEHAISESIYTLIDNAAKYSPPESAITVRAVSGENSVVISVEDRGPGIRADLRERVFEKFFRAMRDGDVTDRRIAGSGMGLAIARGIVEAHHGRIWVEDAEGGHGAKFVIELPINPPSPDGRGPR